MNRQTSGFEPWDVRWRWMRITAMRLFVAAGVLLSACPSLALSDEVREWTSSSGSFKTEAELLGLSPEGKVRLKRKDGAVIEVAMDRLSAADQEFVRAHSAAKEDGGQKKSDAAAAKSVDEVEAEAAACRTAKQAVLIYKFYLASPKLSADNRAAASANMKEWEKKAAEDQVRLGKQWMTKEDADKIHKQARAKVEQAMEALHLNNGDLARKTLEDASRLDPDSIQADFMMGIVYGAIAKNDKKAEICFEKCLKREPDNVSVLNNLAVTMAMQKKYHEAAMNWKTAASSAPKMPGLTQNIGNVIALAGSGKMKVPDKTLQELNEVYDDLVVKHGNPRPTEGGFVFTPPYGAEWNKNGGESSGKKDSVIVSSGSGFVIAPHVILTNRHVVKGATGLLVLDPKKPHGEPLEAELIAESENPDLALVRCKSLDAPAVKFADKLPPRGTDIMVLGFPLGPGFGTTLKSTRGAMVAMPDPALDNMFLYDAITNPGNSGGPLCDKSGHVAGVVRAVTGSVGGTYGAGIPIVDALPFIHQHVPELSVNTGAEKEIDWPAVDALVSPSTVLIMTKEDVRTDAGISVKSGK